MNLKDNFSLFDCGKICIVRCLDVKKKAAVKAKFIREGLPMTINITLTKSADIKNIYIDR